MVDNVNETCNFLRPPKPLIVEHDKYMAKEWKLWKQQYSYFEIATGMINKPNNIQVATFMSAIGYSAIQIFNTFALPLPEAQSEMTLDMIKDLFQSYFIPKVNTTFERYKFHRITQQENETIDELVARLRLQSQNCAFETLLESILRDQLILGIRNDELRTKLLSEDITLSKAIAICQSTEQAQKHAAQIIDENEKKVNYVKKTSSSTSQREKKLFYCRKCGAKHSYRSCPAYNHLCKKCNRKHHFEDMCNAPSTSKLDHSKLSKKVDLLEEFDSDDSSLIIGCIFRDEKSQCQDKFSETISIAKKNYQIKLDTGAQCNVLPKKIVDGSLAKIRPCRVKNLISFSNHRLVVLGESIIPCVIATKECKIAFKVVDADIQPILGANACEKLGLISRINEMNIEKDIYEGLGCIKNFVYDIDLIPNPQFEISAPRRIPYKIRDQVKEELDRMEKLGVIERTIEATPAVSPMVVVRKDNKIRICIDPTSINKNILRRHHPMQSLEEIAAQLKGAKYFTILDCKKGFWQVQLSDRTRKILTFATPWGRYSCKRLPLGISSAPEVFQNKIESMLAHVRNVKISVDDILIHAKSIEELRQITKEVLHIIQQNGLVLNKSKCSFEQKEVKFLGHIISNKGMLADPEKTSAISRLKPPSNRKELQRILGKFTYLSKFIKNFSLITAPLRSLLSKSKPWLWDTPQQTAFENMKNLITKPPVLKLYDVNEDVKLQVDASSLALGAVLLQRDQPVAYASKSLTDCQQRYSQLEKEALAIKFGCEKFHQYIWGKALVVESDHKPLETIFKKPLHSSPARLLRIRLSLLNYNPNVVYKKGDQMLLADPLSRDCKNQPSIEEGKDLQVQMVLAISDQEQKRLKKFTDNDEISSKLKTYILKGWPNNIDSLPSNLKAYWTFKDELSVYDGIIYKSHKVVIPTQLRSDILKYIHHGHFSYEKCVRRAKNIVFWPQINKDIYNYIVKCASCQVHQRSNNKVCLGVKEVAKFPFEIVATDLFFFKGSDYIVLTDSYSGFLKFEKLQEATTSNVIQFLKNIFATHGIPLIVESDNGPQFSSYNFKQFCSEWKFEHKTSSPYHPIGNGLAERAVQTAKNILKKCDYNNSDPQLGVLNFMNTPRGALGTPAQRLYSRNLRSVIPTTVSSLLPNDTHHHNVPNLMEGMRSRQASYANKGASEHRPLQEGSRVLTRINNKEWEPATVDQKVHSRSYILKDDNGRMFRRNSANIRPTQALVKRHSNASSCSSDTIADPTPSATSSSFPTEEAHSTQQSQPSVSSEASTRSGTMTIPSTQQLQPVLPKESSIIIPKTTRYGRVIKPPERLSY